MNAAPEHGDRYGRLTVLAKVKTKEGRRRYRVGCECGYSGTLARKSHLNSGRMTECFKCSMNRSANEADL